MTLCAPSSLTVDLRPRRHSLPVPGNNNSQRRVGGRLDFGIYASSLHRIFGGRRGRDAHHSLLARVDCVLPCCRNHQFRCGLLFLFVRMGAMDAETGEYMLVYLKWC